LPLLSEYDSKAGAAGGGNSSGKPGSSGNSLGKSYIVGRVSQGDFGGLVGKYHGKPEMVQSKDLTYLDKKWLGEY